MKIASSPLPSFEEGLEILKETIEYNQIFAHVAYTNTYIIDIINRKLLCCAVNPIYLYELSETAYTGLDMDSFVKYISREDRAMIYCLVSYFFRFLEKKDRENWGKYSLSIDFRLRNRGEMLVNHTMAPISITNDGRPWHMLVSVMGACHQTSGNARISCKDTREAWRFDDTRQGWIPESGVSLSRGETEILIFATQGLTMEDMGHSVGRTIDAIRTRRQGIFSKLKTRNINQALQKARHLGLL